MTIGIELILAPALGAVFGFLASFLRDEWQRRKIKNEERQSQVSLLRLIYAELERAAELLDIDLRNTDGFESFDSVFDEAAARAAKRKLNGILTRLTDTREFFDFYAPRIIDLEFIRPSDIARFYSRLNVHAEYMRHAIEIDDLIGWEKYRDLSYNEAEAIKSDINRAIKAILDKQ